MTGPALGADVDGSQHYCTYSSTLSTVTCPQPAAWHILWNRAADASFACTEHMATVQRELTYYDRHPPHPDCGMPGARWSVAEKRCGYPADLAQRASQAAAEPVGSPS
ncbi:hypothetical protein AB0P02_01105 [Streptomyces griseoluteus]|uniref:hypothetical protein n=1 Tax=Streptomyces griseoluteus TaxID=29306 RepID=UPI00341FDCED